MHLVDGGREGEGQGDRVRHGIHVADHMSGGEGRVVAREHTQPSEGGRGLDVELQSRRVEDRLLRSALRRVRREGETPPRTTWPQSGQDGSGRTAHRGGTFHLPRLLPGGNWKALRVEIGVGSA